jgi:hypothetical protein
LPSLVKRECPAFSLIARGFVIGKNLYSDLRHEIFRRKVKCEIGGGERVKRGSGAKTEYWGLYLQSDLPAFNFHMPFDSPR